MLVAFGTSCRDESIVPCGACAVGGCDGLGRSPEPAAERSEDPARSGGRTAAMVEAVGPGAGSGAASPSRPETASELEAESRPAPAAAGPGLAAGAAAPPEPGLVAVTSGEAAGAARLASWLGADAGEAGPELEVAMGVERGVTRTRAGVPM
jgi:hypothetical protein